MYFESYLRENNISPDDAIRLRDSQVRGFATFKIQFGPYAGLDQHVKARLLVAKRLKTDPEDRKVFEDSMDMKRLMATTQAAVPGESMELYKSFFDDPLPHVSIYGAKESRDKSAVVDSPDAVSTPPASARASGRKRFGDHRLISVGPLYQLEGGKELELILFNDSAAENGFADVITSDTDLALREK
ncbi:hypothetical protein PINS_up001355 [Pythium insidiosum]|nr:hypothetical protein PINS_up001355 [Pythium insidiosum]